MSLSMYELSVPIFLRGFSVLSNYLDQASAYASANNLDPAVLIEAKLAPDVMSFAAQIQRASDAAKGGVARLAQAEAPPLSDTEVTFAELQERIAKTVAFLRSLDPKKFEGSESRVVGMRLGGAMRQFRGDTYLLQVLLPNFFFHVTTAHDILRHNGVKIGKIDYFGVLDFVEAA